MKEQLIAVIGMSCFFFCAVYSLDTAIEMTKDTGDSNRCPEYAFRGQRRAYGEIYADM
jgi:hypothetical protein